jgi:Zn finger protein HypA/HybF involved in hydrogenase expression
VHELSIALEICRVIEDRLAPEQLPQLVELGLEIGESATIEVANLQFCLDTLLAHPPFAGATVVIARNGGEDTRVSYLEIDDERSAN